MYDKAPPCNVDFFDWLETLSDEEHHEVFLHLCTITEELGLRIDKYAPVPQDLLDLPPHNPTMISLN